REHFLELRVDRIERLLEARLGRLVDARDGVLELRERALEIRLLTGQEREALLQLGAFLDRHEVDLAHAVDQRAQLLESRLFGLADRPAQMVVATLATQ